MEHSKFPHVPNGTIGEFFVFPCLNRVLNRILGLKDSPGFSVYINGSADMISTVRHSCMNASSRQLHEILATFATTDGERGFFVNDDNGTVVVIMNSLLMGVLVMENRDTKFPAPTIVPIQSMSSTSLTWVFNEVKRIVGDHLMMDMWRRFYPGESFKVAF